MAYAVYTTESFEKEISNLSQTDIESIRKICFSLKNNPYVGDALRYRFFREKRLREKRIYFLIYDDLSAVLVVAFGGKKIQQETINCIIKNLPEYRFYIERILNQI